MLIVISLQIMFKLKIEAAENSALKTMVIDSSLIHLAILGAKLQHHFHAHDDYHNFPVVRDARSDLKVRKERTRPDRWPGGQVLKRPDTWLQAFQVARVRSKRLRLYPELTFDNPFPFVWHNLCCNRHLPQLPFLAHLRCRISYAGFYQLKEVQGCSRLDQPFLDCDVGPWTVQLVRPRINDRLTSGKRNAGLWN